ncbi:Ribonuclease BN [Minicystis rosea]|nr:Ribonuclease BN [Minicystis rosea]
MHLPGRDIPWKQFLRDVYREFECDNLLDYAGSVAFSVFLAIFPFLLFVVALAGLVIDPATLDTLVAQIRSVAPPQVADILTDRLHALTTGTAPGLLTLGAIGAIWAASGAVSSLMKALDVAYDVRDSRPFWKTRGLAILVTLAGAVLYIAASAIAIATPAVAHALGGVVGALILWLRWPVAVLLMLLIIACLYYFLPDVEQRFRFITPGSVLAVVVWAVASLGFSLYVGHFGRYEVVYGTLGSVIVLLLWIWISAIVILLGAEINAIIEHYSPEGKRTGAKSMRDVGPDLPESAKH